MKKNDKLIVLAGVAILVIASIGVYYWSPEGLTGAAVDVKTLFSVSGSFSDVPTAITVSDSSPFYALIATPLAVHYDKDGNQEVVPLYVENVSSPSRAVVRTRELVGRPVNLIVDGSETPEEVSLELVAKYWEKSDAVLLIEDSQEGYNLGLVAAPIASYLSIPIIVTDGFDAEVYSVLKDLGVKYSLVCGDFSAYGASLRFTTVDEIMNFTIDLIEDKFGEVKYITLANPLDAFSPKILERTYRSFGPVEVPSAATTQLLNAVINMAKGPFVERNFTIPDDYKYALIKLEVINLDSDKVEEMGDSVTVQCGIDSPDAPEGLQSFELAYGSTSAGIPVRDASGKIIKDRYYKEAILYDRGGAKYNVRVGGSWLTKKSGKVLINVEIDKLDKPTYAMMKKLSSTASYLTAYHKGILFAKPEFAFYPDDDVLTKKGEKCVGYYSVRRNPKLAEIQNNHVFNKIHRPLNKILSKLSGIPVEELRSLREYYKNNPIYIALVGDAEMIPRYIYQNDILPVREEMENPFEYAFGVGTPSDFIYGNIDPIPNDWSNLANDTYSYYPYQENIVGRIATWDVQDASALIVRTFFYDDIVEKLGEWKDNAANLIGGGQDFQMPPLRYAIASMLGSEEPLKLPTGYGKICMERTEKMVLKPMGFNVYSAYDCEAEAVGLSDKALDEIKHACLLNRLLFFRGYVSKFLGEDAAKGREYMEKSNFIWANGHGSPNEFIMPGPSSVAMGIGGPMVKSILERILPLIGGGFFGPGFSLTAVGQYTPRLVEHMNLGPSFLWIDSCLCGKIGGVYPQNSISMAFLHAGVNAVISSPMESNIGGGYLDPKNRKFDFPWSVARAYINTTRNARNGEYPEPHFAYLMYEDMCKDLMENATLGLAFRNARNRYLPEDANWTIWWAPPLVTTGNPFLDFELVKETQEKFKEMFASGKDRMLKNKYFAFQEFVLYGDPAFNPYIPGE